MILNFSSLNCFYKGIRFKFEYKEIFMQNNEQKNSNAYLESNFVLFDLRLRALNIKNGYSIKNSINSLVNFVDTSRLRFSNP